MQDVTEKRWNTWRKLLIEGRQAFLKTLSDDLLNGVEYITFVVRRDGSFFFVPVFYDKPALMKLYLFNSFTVMRKFQQGFELARNFLNTCQLCYNFVFSMPDEIRNNLRDFDLEFTGATEYRRRFKRKGRAFSSLLGFDRPVKLKFI